MNELPEAMAFIGFLLHFLTRYGEHWRTSPDGKEGPHKYVMRDPIGWASALCGVLAGLSLLPEIAPLLGVSVSPVGAFVVGYMGSSLAAKLPGIITPQASGAR